ncbi:MAG: hypothetical protein LCH85_23080 [Chloroflexi bacterium]|nr:hypothetical protein [Chloroflexota bacterium]
MSRLHCTCGHVIVDVSDDDSLHNKGWMVPFYAYRHLIEDYIPILLGYVEAIQQGKGSEWIVANYPPQYTITTLDVVMTATWRTDQSLFLYECDRCQRLWISHPNTPGYYPFKPEFPETTPHNFLRDPEVAPDEANPSDQSE